MPGVNVPPVAALGVIGYGPGATAVGGVPVGLKAVTLPTVSPFCGATGVVKAVLDGVKVSPKALVVSLALIVSGAGVTVSLPST